MFQRNEYLKQLINVKDKDIIKVVCGVRRSGKSTLFEIYQNYLLENGVGKKQIQKINFEELDNENLLEYKKLYEHIKKNLVDGKRNYVLLDEVQQVKDFQKTVDSLHIKKNVDIYITGSNSHLLSGELSTLISGRYIEIKMLPLSFKEYVSTFGEQRDLSGKFKNYLIDSSFPYALEIKDKKAHRDYLMGIYNSVIVKDIAQRQKISDISMLDSIAKFMADNVGNICSIKKISDTMTSAGRKISTHTAESYIKALEDSYILYKAQRYDVKGKAHLKINDKYYFVDMGLRYALLGTQKVDMGRMLENVVYLELLRRGYEVSIGKIGAREVDFVVANNGNIQYYQVAQTTRDKKTLERELAALNDIADHNEKYLLTLDEDPEISYNGIKKINALDWLLWDMR
ncbi:MAG: ATP-binding protein [Elusimicrobiota bacterium]|jgi:predicted AAA+ superfamily ATPase|nr:ATP-binding protein [Elusimicrobiota bacterium]